MKKQLLLLKRLYNLTGPGFARHAFIALGAGLAPVLYNMVMAVALRNVFAAATDGSMHALQGSVIAFALSVIGFFLFNVMTWGLFVASTTRRTGHIRKKLFAHLCGLPAPELERSHSAGIMTFFTSDAAAVENAYGYLLRYTIAAVLSGLTAAVIMLLKSPVMGLVILSTGILQLLCNLLVVKPLQGLSVRIARQIEQAGAVMSDMMEGNITIRLYGMEQRELELYEAKSLELRSLNIRMCLVEGFIKGGNIIVAVISYLLTLAIGTWMVAQGQLTLPDLLFLTQTRGLVMVVVFSIGDFTQMVQPANASAGRLFAFLDKPEE